MTDKTKTVQFFRNNMNVFIILINTFFLDYFNKQKNKNQYTCNNNKNMMKHDEQNMIKKVYFFLNVFHHGDYCHFQIV